MTVPVSGAVLVAGGAALVPLAAATLRFGAYERRVFFARWGFSHVLLAVVVGVVAAFVVPVAIPGEGTLSTIYRSVLLLGSVAAFVAWIATKLQPEGVRSFGFAPGHARAIATGLVTYACLLPFVVGLEGVWPTVMDWIGLAPATTILERILALEGAALAQAVLVCALVQPLFEEVVFRGFLQPLFVQNFGERGGIAVTSFVFAFLHPAQAMLPLFGLSCLLGAIQVRTQRLTAAWAVHAFHNALVLFVAFRFPEARELLY